MLIIGGLVALMTLIGIGGGFILGTVPPLPDLAIGFVLAVVVYLLFAKLLALSLPMGPSSA